jgi:hypothetical protein
MTVSVSPSSFTLAKGASQSLNITITNVSATLNAYTGGQLRLSDGTHSVRVPMVIRPVALGAPTSVSGSGAAISYPVKFGYTGSFTASARGLIAPTITQGTVADDPADGSCSLTASAYMQQVPVAIPAGTTYARFGLFDADVNAGSDIDLCVFNAGGTLVGSSTTGTSAEQVNLLSPPAGTYTVVVHGWGVASPPSPFKLHTWLLGSTAAGNMAVSAPASATIGTTGTINLTFSGLAAGTKYLGSVAYSGTSGLPNPTIVSVNTP